MAKFGLISSIKKPVSAQIQTMENSLLQKGYTRMLGTAVYKYPYKELDNRYRTGLDPEAAYIKRMQDGSVEKDLEIKRVTELRAKLEKILQVDLSPNSKFWNYKLSQGTDDLTHVQPVKLIDGDNYFDYSNPWRELEFAWLRVHPTIASSYEAWQRGEFPAETQWYVVDHEIETKLAFDRKQLINKAIGKFETMTPSKRRKVARQLGLPITDDTVDEQVYNQIDSAIKQTEFTSGKHKGLNPVKVFLKYAEMAEELLQVKDLVKQAIDHSIYRFKSGGKLYEGEFEVADSEDSLVKLLMDDEHQEDLIALEKKLKSKKLQLV